ncbi:SHOCT domain-containing protein [Natronobacterium texcoconense]|uniref:Short C-terminal domain-containing protein n=1 Tax=Natronobacterium texcoconense TaxID=1095778 RepID=A0A1H1ER33_NATTX|nr:SHOCT domain-containing protein [Natronobacterium texcoconense]SDQ91211.1 Short C-terminal domain-containing protein [Natronobacterium texcoconense]
MAESGGREYSLAEIFAIKFVLADVVIIAALLLAGPWVAVAITALFVLSFVLVWYLMQTDESSEEATADAETKVDETAVSDPVTALQSRYAAGELSDAEFEEKLERLIDANERADEAGVETDELELEFER